MKFYTRELLGMLRLLVTGCDDATCVDEVKSHPKKIKLSNELTRS